MYYVIFLRNKPSLESSLCMNNLNKYFISANEITKKKENIIIRVQFNYIECNDL